MVSCSCVNASVNKIKLIALLALRYANKLVITVFYCVRVPDPLTNHMEMVTEIVVPTVCTLCILITALFLMFILRKRI